MSKTIVIQEGGQGKTLTADKLRTALAAGGSCDWVPEDELTEKTITEDGTYRAADEGLLGYSVVTVRGIGKVTGTDADGNPAYAHVDPSTGQIVVDEMPTSISVITPPTNPQGIYSDGQTISTEGMVVKGYLTDGAEWGTVSINEITLVPDVAAYDESTDYRSSTKDDITARFIGASSVKVVAANGLFEDYTAISGEGPFYAFATHYHGPLQSGIGVYICSPNPFSATQTIPSGTGAANVQRYVTLDEKVTYFAGRDAFQDSMSPSANAPLNESGEEYPGANTLAYVICHGTHDSDRDGSRQQINVVWPRIGDGLELMTSFEILVAPPYGGSGDDGHDSGSTIDI